MVNKPKKAKNEVKKKTLTKPKAKAASVPNAAKIKPPKVAAKKGVELKASTQLKVKPKAAVKKKEAVIKKDRVAFNENIQAAPAAVPPKEKVQPVSVRPASTLPKTADTFRDTDDNILTLKGTKREIEGHPAKPKAAPVSLKQEPVKPEAPVEIPRQQPVKELELKFPVTVKDIAIKLQEKPSVIIKLLMDMRIMAGINQALDEQTVAKLCEKLNCKITCAPGEEEQALAFHKEEDKPELLKPRSPIVTLMGHVTTARPRF